MWLKIRHKDTVFKVSVFLYLCQTCKQIFNIYRNKKKLDKLFLIFKGLFLTYCGISLKCLDNKVDNVVSYCKIFLSTGFQQ